MKNHKPPVTDSPDTSRETRNDSRRRLMKAVAAGGGAAVVGSGATGTWVTPSVQSAILPAHAQATGFQRARVVIEPIGNRFSPMDLFLSEANAQVTSQCPFPTDLCFQTVPGSAVMQVFASGVLPWNSQVFNVSTTVSTTANSFQLVVTDCFAFEVTDVVINESASPRTIAGKIRCENRQDDSVCFPQKDEVDEESFSEIFTDGTC